MSETSFSRKLVSVLFGVPFIILIFACPVFEILKLEYFNRTNEKLVYDTNVEYTYLVLSLIAPISYTIFTIHELGDIPFTCPKDSNYSAQVQNACRVRAINLVLMWTFAFFLIMNILSFVFEMYSFNENGGGKFVERSIPKILYDDKDDENTQRYLSPITQPPLGTDSKGGEQHQFSKIELGGQQQEQQEENVNVPTEQSPGHSPVPSIVVKKDLSRTSSIRKSERLKPGSRRKKGGSIAGSDKSDKGSSDEGKSK